jgi:hypothetical protein
MCPMKSVVYPMAVQSGRLHVPVPLFRSGATAQPVVHRPRPACGQPRSLLLLYATLRATEIKPYEYRDPGQVVRDVAATHPLIEGDALDE